VVPFDLVNFKILGSSQVRAGVVHFVLRGVGPTMHEFNVARTDASAAALPLEADGTVDDQGEHAGFVHLADRVGVDIGDRSSLTVDLAPGHYVLYCNMYGHYQAGMRADLTVT
jgi:uncharacterized cupredoxin-like copper-binding protein